MKDGLDEFRFRWISINGWSTLVLVPLIYLLVTYAMSDHDFQKMRDLSNFLYVFIPLVVVFALHNLVLLRFFYNKKRYKTYFILIFVLYFCFCIFSYVRLSHEKHPIFDKNHNDVELKTEEALLKPMSEGFERQQHDSILSFMPDDRKQPVKQSKEFTQSGNKKNRETHGPNPLAIDMILATLLLISDFVMNRYKCNLRRKEEYERLEREKLNSELQYLKAQLNPHFFMNTLNNIHAMVELHPQVAQEMIMELSKLMRYVLYEGNRNLTTLSTEVEFIENYVSLMKKRYSAKKVNIKVELPHEELYGVKIPPLLFMVIIENAFKHGISYRSHSGITILLEILEENKVKLVCANSKWNKKKNSEEEYGGIGLKNLQKRLSLLYGTNYSLDIIEKENTYKATLIIPYEYDENNKVFGD